MLSIKKKTPITLSIDTSSIHSSYAIACGEEILASICSEPGALHSQTIFQNLSMILEQAQLKIEDIDLFAAVTGPGSFTGLRVGLSTIKGLADTTNKPAYGIGSIDAVALTAGHIEPALIIIEAGRKEVYAGIRQINNDRRSLKGNNYNFDDTVAPLDVIRERFPDLIIVRGGELKNIASFAAIEAYHLHLDNAPSGIIPVYIRKSDAELSMKK